MDGCGGGGDGCHGDSGGGGWDGSGEMAGWPLVVLTTVLLVTAVLLWLWRSGWSPAAAWRAAIGG